MIWPFKRHVVSRVEERQDAVFEKVKNQFLSRDTSLGQVLFSKHDWERTKIAFDILKSAKRVADVGIGQGQLVSLLAEKSNTKSVIGIDFRRHSKLLEPSHPNFEYIEWDITTEIPDIPTVEIVVAMEVLEHVAVDKVSDALRALRQLSHTGTILVTVPYKEQHPLFHFDKPYGHKQSFDDRVVERIFGGNMIYTNYHERWYLILLTDGKGRPKKMNLSKFIQQAQKTVRKSVN